MFPVNEKVSKNKRSLVGKSYFIYIARREQIWPLFSGRERNILKISKGGTQNE